MTRYAFMLIDPLHLERTSAAEMEDYLRALLIGLAVLDDADVRLRVDFTVVPDHGFPAGSMRLVMTA